LFFFRPNTLSSPKLKEYNLKKNLYIETNKETIGLFLIFSKLCIFYEFYLK